MWIDARGAGAWYPAAGNIRAGAGEKGTLAIWQWPQSTHDNTDLYWRLEVNSSNYIRQCSGRTLGVCSNGTIWYASTEWKTATVAWEHLVYTWDFTVADQGHLRVYWNGVDAGYHIDTAKAPVGTPTKLDLGPVTGTISHGPHMMYSMAVWDDVMTAAQAATLWREGLRYQITGAEGNGNLTLYAGFNDRLDADYAAGDGTFHVDGAADRYCLVDDGAREQGIRRFLIGTPRHDFSEDDRVPLGVPCTLTLDAGRASFVQDTNYTNYAELKVFPGYGGDRRIGAAIPGRPVLDNWSVPRPGTYRQRVHVPKDNPSGRYIRVGPVDYLHYPTLATNVYDQWTSGRSFSVVSDAGNTATSFKTDFADGIPSDYWNGASITILTGNCADRRVKAVDYDATTKVLTLDSPLPAIPSGGSLGVADHGARLTGCRSWGSTQQGQRIVEMTMDALLWEFHGDQRYFTELEWQYAEEGNTDFVSPNVLRYDRGRTAFMDGSGTSRYENGACYGKPSMWEPNTLECRVLLERVEVEGPTTYQVLRRDANGVGPDLADNFMLVQGDGESPKAWRVKQLSRKITRPTKQTSPEAVRADLTAPGTWRHDIGSAPIPVLYDEATKESVALIVGVDSGGVSQIGYIRGSWNTQTGRIRWVDDTPPAGKQNPFLAVSDLRPGKERDVACNTGYPVSVVRCPDGTWSLVYVAQSSHPDHFMGYQLCGAPDRWSFSREKHWWEGNPICPILGGADRLAPQMNGFGVWANRDADWKIIENPYEKAGARRYFGIARGKSIHDRVTMNCADLRPVIGVRGSDPRSLQPLPHGNTVSPLVGPLVHAGECAVLDQADCLGLYTDTATAMSSGVYCYVSEDGVHFQQFASDGQWIPRSELVGEPSRLVPDRPFQLGDKRVYYYESWPWVNFASIRLGGEAWYELGDGQTTGLLETPLLEKPAEGWGTLRLNCAPEAGQIAVEVLDGATEQPMAGFTAADFDGCVDGVSVEALWKGQRLGSLTTDLLRLRFVFGRSSSAVATPKLYGWRVAEAPEAKRPRVSELRVEGQENPTRITDPTPEFAWQYAHDEGKAQSAYQVIVASSRELLDQGIGDVWDSGVVSSSESRVVYDGGALASEHLYLWRVRVRDERGVWSEEW